jgi:hypothetical protein
VGSPSDSLPLDTVVDPPPERGTFGCFPAPIRSFSRLPWRPHEVECDDLSIGSPMRFLSPVLPAAAETSRSRCILPMDPSSALILRRDARWEQGGQQVFGGGGAIGSRPPVGGDAEEWRRVRGCRSNFGRSSGWGGQTFATAEMETLPRLPLILSNLYQ